MMMMMVNNSMPFDFKPVSVFGSLREDMTSSTKPEVDNVSSEKDGGTDSHK